LAREVLAQARRRSSCFALSALLARATLGLVNQPEAGAAPQSNVRPIGVHGLSPYSAPRAAYLPSQAFDTGDRGSHLHRLSCCHEPVPCCDRAQLVLLTLESHSRQRICIEQPGPIGANRRSPTKHLVEQSQVGLSRSDANGLGERIVSEWYPARSPCGCVCCLIVGAQRANVAIIAENTLEELSLAIRRPSWLPSGCRRNPGSWR
jgi:hypothetical protein